MTNADRSEPSLLEQPGARVKGEGEPAAKAKVQTEIKVLTRMEEQIKTKNK